MAVTDLTFVDVETVQSGGSMVSVMKFTATELRPTGWTMTGSCSPGADGLDSEVTQTMPVSATGTLSGDVTLFLTGFAFTEDGAAYGFTPASPPVGSPFPVASGTLTGVSLVATTISAGTATFPGAVESAPYC